MKHFMKIMQVILALFTIYFFSCTTPVDGGGGGGGGTASSASSSESGSTSSSASSTAGTVETPVMSPLGGTFAAAQNVTITCATVGATIYYTTNGSDPDQSSTEYTVAVAVNGSLTLKARAYLTGWTGSAIASEDYTITGSCAAPTFSESEGTYNDIINVSMSTTTPDAKVYYTTNGDDPATSGIEYTSALIVNRTITVRAIARLAGWTDSMESTITYILKAATPAMSPASGTFTSTQNVTISCTSPGVTIYYTTDGNDPNTGDTEYTASISISATTTLKAIAVRSNWTNSEIAIETYTITGTVETPVMNPSGGTYATARSVTITCATPGATIYYTTNGSDPDQSSTEYTGAVAVNGSLTLKARAYLTGWTGSAIASEDYMITGSCAAPTFSETEGTYYDVLNVTISTTTPGADVLYTTNGSDPATSGITYTAPVIVNKTTAIRTIARLTGWSDSVESTITYTLKVQTPAFNPVSGTFTSAQNITISCATSGATIYFTTNGDDPTTGDTEYTSAVSVSSSMTLKAIAVKTNWSNSSVGSEIYVITGTVATPVMSPAGGTYTSARSVTITSATPGATIYYTTNGNDPTTGDTEYTSAVNVGSSMTLKAIAVKTLWTDSAVAAEVYTITGIVATPVMSPTGGTFSSAQSVTITCATGSATIYYTTDGADPTTADSVYSSAISIPLGTTMTIKAFAVKVLMTDSAIASETYVVTNGVVATPVMSPSGGTYITAQNITITCSTGGSEIHYTTDGSTPTASSALYTAAINIPLATTMTINAIAIAAGWTDSAEASQTYYITGTVATPVMSPAGGTYSSTQNVSITCSTIGATIYYTTNGADPTTSDEVYLTPVNVPASTTMTIKALAVKTGWANSAIAGQTYVIDPNVLGVVLSTAAPNPTNSSFTLTITFDSAVQASSFTSVDITFTSGSGSATAPSTSDNITFTSTITPSSQGTVTLTIPAGSVYDGVSKFNSAAPPLTLVYDSVKPNVALSSTTQTTTSINPIPVKITFSEAINPGTFTVGDISVTNGTAGTPTTLDNITWTTSITPAAVGTVTVNFNAGVVSDPAGNTNNAATALTRTYFVNVGYDASYKSNSATITGVAVGNNSNRVLIVGVQLFRSANGGLSISGVTYGGASMNLIPGASLVNGKNGNRMITQLYYLNNPAVGSATVSVTQSGANAIEIFALSLYDTFVHSGSALGAVKTNMNSTAPVNSITTSITTTVADSMVVDVAGGNTAAVISAGSSQTIRQQAGTGVNPAAELSTKQTTTAGATAMNFTFDTAQGYRINQVITEIKAAR